MAKRTVEEVSIDKDEIKSNKQIKVISGDSLEEDFVLEDDFNQDFNSEDEQVDLSNTDDLLKDLDELNEVIEPEEEQEGGGKKKKRKLNVTTSGSNSINVPKVGEKNKIKKVKESFDNSINLGTLPLEELLKLFSEKQKRALPNLSPMEMDDFKILESMIVDTSSILDRKSLMSFIRESVPTLPSTLAKPPKRAGSPRVIVISGAALRVADLCREVKAYKTKDVDIAKLFSKHFKLPEHVEYLEKTKVAIAVGVPGRIGKLLNETEALSLTHLSHLILDVTHIDSKNRSLLDLADSREDMFKLVLGFKPLMDRLREGRMKIIFW